MRAPIVSVGPVARVLTLTAAFLGGCGGVSYSSRSVPYDAPPLPSPMVAASATPGAPAESAEKKSEAYKDYGVNPTVDPTKDRLSTFAIDVDTASYTISRRKIMEGELPPREAVRVEEFLNYFDYGYEGPKPDAAAPFAVHLDAAPSPFTAGHHLIRVGIQGKRLTQQERKPVHLVYLVDTSGSMQSPDKIGLARKSLRLLTESLHQGDTVALCTYAGSTREILPPTGALRRGEILAAIDELAAGGSTAMESGLQIAYRLAEKTRVPGHVNRVVVLSDGDANVGATTHGDILKSIQHYKDQGITLSTVGFGNGNYKDTMMEQLADQGDGNYSYIDSEAQARRVFSEQVSQVLEVIARDVKVQVEFDPAVVKQYRLVGYENRDIADKDFRNDKVDAGEIGAGHSVTAVYDVVLKSTTSSPITVRLRHKAPAPSAGSAIETVFAMSPSRTAPSFEAAPASLRFAAAVTEFGEILRQSPHARGVSLAQVEQTARAAALPRADQQEFLGLVRKADALSGGKALAVAR
jgi:Ca-activated chloride channel homolog